MVYKKEKRHRCKSSLRYASDDIAFLITGEIKKKKKKFVALARHTFYPPGFSFQLVSVCARFFSSHLTFERRSREDTLGGAFNRGRALAFFYELYLRQRLLSQENIIFVPKLKMFFRNVCK